MKNYTTTKKSIPESMIEWDAEPKQIPDDAVIWDLVPVDSTPFDILEPVVIPVRHLLEVLS